MILINLEYCLVLTFLFLQIWDIGCRASPEYVISVPAEVTAQTGLCVHIPCSFSVPSSVIISRSAKGFWYRPAAFQNKVAWNRDSTRTRIFFTGDVSKGDCSLFINDVQKEDENTYQFRLEDSVSYNYFNVKPRLKVTGLTEKPQIFVGKLVAGEKATLTCRSPGKCAGSAPDISWSGRHGESMTFSDSYAHHSSIYFSNITFTPLKEDNGSPLICKASFLQNRAVTMQSISLNVEYAPDITITIGEPFTRNSLRSDHATNDIFIVKEGDIKMINCNVDSNPLAKITWFMGDEVKQGPTVGSTLIYSLNKIRLSDAGKYLCMGMNDHGNSTRTIEIIVHYGPRTPNIVCLMTKDCTIDNQLRIVYVLENSTFSLLCTAASLPEASLSWVKSRSRIGQSGASGHLTLHNVSINDEGKLTCEARNNYGESVSVVNIRVTYKPRKVREKSSSCLEHESHMQCVCLIQSFPTANIEWTINEKIYSSNHEDKELNIFTVTMNAMTNSTLILKSSWMNIRTVRCMSSNKHGRLELLLLDSSYNIEIIAAVSCVAVIVLLLIGGFVLIHYFRKKKLAMKPEDKKEINANDCICTNSDEHLYGNQVTEIGTSSVYSVHANSDSSLYMNLEDVQYTTVNFSKLKAKNAPENDEIEYAEIRK